MYLWGQSRIISKFVRVFKNGRFQHKCFWIPKHCSWKKNLQAIKVRTVKIVTWKWGLKDKREPNLSQRQETMSDLLVQLNKQNLIKCSKINQGRTTTEIIKTFHSGYIVPVNLSKPKLGSANTRDLDLLVRSLRIVAVLSQFRFWTWPK